MYCEGALQGCLTRVCYDDVSEGVREEAYEREFDSEFDWTFSWDFDWEFDRARASAPCNCDRKRDCKNARS